MEPDALARLVSSEIEEIGEMPGFYGRLSGEQAIDIRVAELARIKELHCRMAFSVDARETWFRAYGWKMAKTLMLLGLLVLGVAAITRNYADYAITALLGAAAYYGLLVILSLFEFRKKKRILQKVEDAYRTELIGLLSGVVLDNGLDADDYPFRVDRKYAGTREMGGEGVYVVDGA